MKTRKELTEIQKGKVNEWLKHERIDYCPFAGEGVKTVCPICQSWFPKIGFLCPCHIYSLSTIIKRAKEMMK